MDAEDSEAASVSSVVDSNNKTNVENEAQDSFKSAKLFTEPECHKSSDDKVTQIVPDTKAESMISAKPIEVVEQTDLSAKPKSSSDENASNENIIIDVDQSERKDNVTADVQTDLHVDAKETVQNDIVDLDEEEDLANKSQKDERTHGKIQCVEENKEKSLNEPVVTESLQEGASVINETNQNEEVVPLGTRIIDLSDDSSEETNIYDLNEESCATHQVKPEKGVQLQNTENKTEEGLLAKSDKSDVHVLDNSDELIESISENHGERSNLDNAKNSESQAPEPCERTESEALTSETVEVVPSVSQCDEPSTDITAASKCNGVEHKDEKMEAMDGIQNSADVFELMKENEHLFDSDKHLNGPEPDIQQIDEVQALTENENDRHEKENDNSIQRKECINVDCLHLSSMFYDAPEFVINHFHLKKRHTQMFVCDICFDECIEKYGVLCASLQDKQPLFLQKIKYSGLVEIIDSSDEEDEVDSKSDNRNQAKFGASTLSLLEKNLEDVLKESFAKIDIKQQMDWNHQILSSKIEQNKRNTDEILSEFKVAQRKADKMYFETYSIRNTMIENAQSLDLTTGRPTQIVNEFYPPAGQLELELKPLNSHSLYYSFRKMQRSWVACKFVKEVENDGKKLNLIQFSRERLNGTNTKYVPLKHMAYGSHFDVRLNVGTRVIALCNDNEDPKNSKNRSKICFFPGVIAEPLNSYTKWRYMVFFDDGYCKYVQHEDVRVICEHSEKVWELIDDEGAKNYIKDYVENFRKAQKRPIVDCKKGQKMITECNGQWHTATVMEVDGSLVQVSFDGSQRSEWIYRGSTRLHPLWRRLNGLIQTVKTTFEYIVIDDDKEPSRSADTPKENVVSPSSVALNLPNRKFASQAQRDTPQQNKRAVSKKSTAILPRPAVQFMNNSTIYVDEDKPKGKVVYYTAKKHNEPKKFVSHTCESGCLLQISHSLRPYSPLSKPLLSGFERQICRTKFNKKCVVYRGPCGRRLRDITEVHLYLRMTECPLNVENFDFDVNLHCLAEFVVDSFKMKKPDISEGVEQMAVSCVNSYDNSEAPPLIYSNIRTPTEGVNLNLDPAFLCGCDCTDDCMDKTKCQCWQLTLAGAKYGNPDTPIDNVGYEFKRLYEHVPLGIYECNSNCKCKSNCLNRVVQEPLKIKLQVFKTVNRGWGIRTLNDLPKGCFVCCYAGNLLTEAHANEAGEHLGDEYFAELDYIEVVSNLKEGYESDIEESNNSSTDEDFDMEREKQHENDDSDDEEFMSRHYMADNSIKKRYRTRNSVDTRNKKQSATSTATNGKDKKKEPQNSSDSEGESRLQKNFMASDTMPDDPDEDHSRSIRALYGKDEAVYVMDAKKTGNMGRYFNHSCGPNLFVQNVFVDTHDLRFPWVAFFAISHIRAGTELTWNYNYEVGSVKGKVLICQCGDTNCRGRIL